MDELLACGILIYATKCDRCDIIRISDVSAIPHLLPANSYVVDIGGRYDGVQYFDHHQDDPVIKNDCSAVMVARHLAPQLLADQKWGKYLSLVSEQDTLGKNRMSQPYPFEFMVMQEGMLDVFEEDPTRVAMLVAKMIALRFSTLELNKAARKWFSNNHKVEEYKNFKALIINSDSRLEGVDSRAVNRVVSGWQNKNKEVEICVNWGDRGKLGEERVIFVTHGGISRGLDLNLIKDSIKCLFIHNAGFLLVYSVADYPDYLVILHKLDSMLNN